MVLATREDAQFLSDAVQGDGDPLSVLQEFERSPRPTLEELKTFEYEILSDLTTSMMYIVGDKVLLKLEEKMKGTDVEGRTKELFAGSSKSYIKCVDVDYKSERDEVKPNPNPNLRPNPRHDANP